MIEFVKEIEIYHIISTHLENRAFDKKIIDIIKLIIIINELDFFFDRYSNQKMEVGR